MSVKQKAIVLLSSGLDSTVNCYQAKEELDVCLALTFDYGQRAANSELSAAAKIASRLKIPHQVVYLGFMVDFGSSALIDKNIRVPVGSDVRIDDLPQSQKTAQAVWVPNRNGILLNIAAGYAESMGARFIIPGFNAEEALTFADNSEAFLDSLNASFAYSTQNKVKVKCYTTKMKKPDIVNLGKKLQVVWSDIWPCYFTGEKWCGECESCLRTKRAFVSAQVKFGELFAK